MRWRGVVLLPALLVAVPSPGQSVLERTPNLEGVWAPGVGSLQFNFLHRFTVSDAPLRKVQASPTFLVAVGGPARTSVGARYAATSLLVPQRFNEWELFARWVAVRQSGGGPADVGLQLSHNRAAESVDGELLLGRDLGPVRVLAGARAFSSFAGGDGGTALVGGVRVRATRHLAVAADRVEPLGDDARSAGWGAGLQLEIPYTPHSLSLHVTNVNATTLQSGSYGLPVAGRDRRWGFEFTTPLTWGRFRAAATAGRAAERRAAAHAGSPDADAVAAVVDMDNSMSFLPDTVRIRAGEAVLWRNGGAIIHTVTADPSRAVVAANVSLPAGARPFDSGDMRPGDEFTHRFTVPGEYRYICVPHEMAGMVGVVIVE